MAGELSRRDFLERTAYAAGLAGAAGLPASTLLSEAATAGSRVGRSCIASGWAR
jgi:hypothetical protein